MRSPGWKSAIAFSFILVLFAKWSIGFQEKRIKSKTVQMRSEITRSLVTTSGQALVSSLPPPSSRAELPQAVPGDLRRKPAAITPGPSVSLTRSVAPTPSPTEELSIAERSYCPGFSRAVPIANPSGLCEYNAACLVCPDSRVIPGSGADAKCGDSDQPPVLNDIVCCAPRLMSGDFGPCPSIDICRDQDIRTACEPGILGR